MPTILIKNNLFRSLLNLYFLLEHISCIHFTEVCVCYNKFLHYYIKNVIPQILAFPIQSYTHIISIYHIQYNTVTCMGYVAKN
jgi:hypothetical protein